MPGEHEESSGTEAYIAPCDEVRQSAWRRGHRKLRELPWRGFFALLGGVISHLTYGTIHTFGNMNTYITSYMRYNGYPDLTYGDTMVIVSAGTLVQGILMPATGLLARKIGQKWATFTGSLFVSGGTLLTYFAIDHSMWLVVITYGVLFRIGLAMSYVPPMVIGMNWFPGRKGLVNGIVVGGFGLGAFIFNQVQTAYVNPYNVKIDNDGYFTDPEVLNRVPKLFLLLGGVYLALQVAGILMIQEEPRKHIVKQGLDEKMELNNVEGETETVIEESEDVDVKEDDHKEESTAGEGISTNSIHLEEGSKESEPQQASNPKIGKDNFTPLQILKTKEFYMLWFCFLINMLINGYINGMYKAYGQTFIKDDHFLALVGAIASIFNCGGRSFWGLVMDSSTYKTCMMIVATLHAALLFSFITTSLDGKAMFAIWVWGLFLGISGNFVLMPTATTQAFGPKYYGTNYGLVFTNLIIAGPMISLLTSGLTDSLGWFGMFVLLGCGAIIVAVITWFFPTIQSSTK